MTPKHLVEHGEHEQEWGGYFVIKGHEKLVRMLLMTRRNYPIAIKRSGWKQRGSLFSDYGISIRCVKNDQTATVRNVATSLLIKKLKSTTIPILLNRNFDY